MAAEHNRRHPGSPGTPQGQCRRLSACPARPGVVNQQDAGTGNRPSPEPAGIKFSLRKDSGARGQHCAGTMQVRRGHGQQRVAARPGAPGRHDGQVGRATWHVRCVPHARSMITQEHQQQGAQQAGRGRAGHRGLVLPQPRGVRAALDRVSHGDDDVRQAAGSTFLLLRALVAASAPPGWPAASRARPVGAKRSWPTWRRGAEFRRLQPDQRLKLPPARRAHSRQAKQGRRQGQARPPTGGRVRVHCGFTADERLSGPRSGETYCPVGSAARLAVLPPRLACKRSDDRSCASRSSPR